MVESAGSQCCRTLTARPLGVPRAHPPPLGGASLGFSCFFFHTRPWLDPGALLCRAFVVTRNQYHKSETRATALANKKWEDEKARLRAAAAGK